MDILELRGDVRQEDSPGAHSKRRPHFTRNRAPPRQRSSRQESHSHFNLLRGIRNSTYEAVLLQIEEPISQLLGITFKFSWFVQLQLRSCSPSDLLCCWYRCSCCHLLHCRKSRMPSCTHFLHHFLHILWRCVCCMGQCIIQVLVRQLCNLCRHRYSSRNQLKDSIVLA